MSAPGHASLEMAEAPPLPTRLTRGHWTASLTPGGIFLAVFVWRSSANPYGSRRFTLFDDAMISMTYGRTLARTGELVWFPGAPRVQGITNPLWTLYMAFLHAIGLEGSGAALAISVTSLVLLLATARIVGGLIHECTADLPATNVISLVTAGAIPFLYPLTYWSLRGMEVGVLAFALALLVRVLLRSTDDLDRRALTTASIACVVGVTTRLDFAPLAVVAIITSMWKGPGLLSFHRSARTLAGVVAAAVAAVLVLQRLYYGDALPNTYRLKVEGFTAWERIERGLMVSGKLAPLIVVCLIAVVLVARHRSLLASRTVLVVAAVFLTAAAYSIWVGGDAWEADLLLNRYVSVVLPLVTGSALISIGMLVAQRGLPRLAPAWGSAMILACGLVGLLTNPFGYDLGTAVEVGLFVMVCLATVWRAARLGWRGRRTAIGATAVLVIGLVGGGPLLTWSTDGAAYSDTDQMQTEYGTAMKRLTAPSAVIGTVWAGAPAYYADRPMIDFLGKSDPVIAGVAPRGPLHPGHNKWDHLYSIDQLLPRVALQIWASDGDTLHMIGVNGYYFRCFDLGNRVGGAYFRLGDEIAEERLTVCDGVTP